MNAAELLEKLNARPAVELDDWEKEAIAEYKRSVADGTAEFVPFEEVKARAARANGRVSLRIPRELHIQLIADAEANGVSLNQYIMYKLARS